MRLFSFLLKFTFICNIAFLLFVFFRCMEMRKSAVPSSSGAVIEIPFFKDLIITLGVSAIVINVIMNIGYVLFMRGKMKGRSLWLPLVNFGFLLLQVFYFFF